MGGRPLAERFVRALVIEVAAHAIEALTLLAHGRRRWRHALFLQREMKPLMPPILLRVTGVNAIQLNSEFQPPHRQGERRPGPFVAKGDPLSVRTVRGSP